MELTFVINEHARLPRRPRQAVFRWFRSFVSHDPNAAFKPSPFTVEVRSHNGELVRGFPAVSRGQADDLLARLQAECKAAGVDAFLLSHSTPTHYITRTVKPS